LARSGAQRIETPSGPPLAGKIILRRLDELIPFAKNSRKHSERQIAQIAASIREFGFTAPILTDAAGNIVAGHGRVLAARKLGLVKIPTIDVSYMSAAQRRAYVIADNKLALNATWDDQMLAVELADLGAAGFDLGLVGFSAGELKGLGIGGMVAGDAPHEDVPGTWAVVVECEDEEDQVELITRLEAEGRKCKGAIG
jgi:ParB-like chromosome segregation protein Spo0J